FYANNYEQLPNLAQEMVALNPDVIFATTTPAVKALQARTRTIPIVFMYMSDPVGAGVVSSLARPGGNITGLLLYEDSITGKWLGMLKEISPPLARAALLANPKGFTYDYFLRSSKTIAPALGIEIVPAPPSPDPRYSVTPVAKPLSRHWRSLQGREVRWHDHGATRRSKDARPCTEGQRRSTRPRSSGFGRTASWNCSPGAPMVRATR